eukprot:TRINITY_DN26939_c0_g1_i2.p2 TRINITY_DN26939_c0_g1~~TRINITY_DN26939_c0_g1_i2.p2  ORF type:complete len:127 (-),score=2.09 TRINITY_DN26939_c0_g1_i2:178-558(-)
MAPLDRNSKVVAPHIAPRKSPCSLACRNGNQHVLKIIPIRQQGSGLRLSRSGDESSRPWNSAMSSAQWFAKSALFLPLAWHKTRKVDGRCKVNQSKIYGARQGQTLPVAMLTNSVSAHKDRSTGSR